MKVCKNYRKMNIKTRKNGEIIKKKKNCDEQEEELKLSMEKKRKKVGEIIKSVKDNETNKDKN